MPSNDLGAPIHTDPLVVLQIRRVALTPEVQYKTEYSNKKEKMKLHMMNRYYCCTLFGILHCILQ